MRKPIGFKGSAGPLLPTGSESIEHINWGFFFDHRLKRGAEVLIFIYYI